MEFLGCVIIGFFGGHYWSFLGVGADDDEVVEAHLGLSRLVLHCSRRREGKNQKLPQGWGFLGVGFSGHGAGVWSGYVREAVALAGRGGVSRCGIY